MSPGGVVGKRPGVRVCLRTPGLNTLHRRILKWRGIFGLLIDFAAPFFRPSRAFSCTFPTGGSQKALTPGYSLSALRAFISLLSSASLLDFEKISSPRPFIKLKPPRVFSLAAAHLFQVQFQNCRFWDLNLALWWRLWNHEERTGVRSRRSAYYWVEYCRPVSLHRRVRRE